MKLAVTFIILGVFSTSVFSQTPCENGVADGYPCSGYDLQSSFTVEQLGSTRGNDSWGWTDPDDGKEYALVGLRNGTAFIDVTDPVNPIYLGKLPTHTVESIWRDIKVYNNYAFIVSEANNHGMQVFDLTRLKNVSNPPEIFTEDAHYNGFGRSHNIAINEDTGYAYSLGDNTYSGGVHFIDISNPLNPIAAGGYAADGYTHDAQIVTYQGPDTDYTGKEILFGSNEDKVVIVDVTNKNNPQHIASITYTNADYTHQGWITEDHKYFLLGDEADEIDYGFNTKTIIFDFSDLDNPQHFFDYIGPTQATDHNVYVKGSKFYISNNAAGLRVVNIEDIENQNIFEEGYFDSFPSNNSAGYTGVWNVYPFFESGNIIMSDRENFLLVKSQDLSINEVNLNTFKTYPIPTSETLTISANKTPIYSFKIIDNSGRIFQKEKTMNKKNINLNISKLENGMYFIIINNQFTQKFVKK